MEKTEHLKCLEEKSINQEENRTKEENTTELLRLKGAIVFPSTTVQPIF